ncbi:MAG TPA: SRPBCC domain-containing protein [Gemmobacter sp.]|nr:SRPBCC domain-containing protein [Gemmobacter sp.]
MSHFATLQFERSVAAPLATLWQAWTAPAARALWAAPTPDVTVEFLEANPLPGGREVSLCKVAGQPDIRCEATWLELETPTRSVNCETVSAPGKTLSSALVTAIFSSGANGLKDESHISLTVQLSARQPDMETGYRMGFDAGLANLEAVARRCMVLRRTIAAPRAQVWEAWMTPETLPLWWGPEGFTCRTQRIALEPGGEWVFDMIGPDGTVFPNHHRYHDMQPHDRFSYSLHWGENGPKHADAWASFEDCAGGTVVTLGMVFSTEAEYQTARDFGAEALGQQTLGKLAGFVGAA